MKAQHTSVRWLLDVISDVANLAIMATILEVQTIVLILDFTGDE